MPDTLIIVKGILKSGGVVVKKFVTRHDSPDQITQAVQMFLKDTNEAGGIMFVRDEKKARSPENSIYFFKEAFNHLEFEVKTMTGSYDLEGPIQ